MHSPLVLAYLGDAVYELYIREYLINKNICKVNNLQRESINYVSAKAQRKTLENLIDQNLLSEKEKEIITWGRNAKGRISKNNDIVTYRLSTGFECLIGYLYLHDKKRLNVIITSILKKKNK